MPTRDAAFTPSDDAAFWMLKTYMGILRSHCDNDCGLATGNLIPETAGPHRANVRYWHLADIPSCTVYVRFRGNSGHAFLHCKCLLLTQSGHWLRTKRPPSSVLV
jgi:hypothetical protein